MGVATFLVGDTDGGEGEVMGISAEESVTILNKKNNNIFRLSVIFPFDLYK
jgi:hypothetical protein